MLALFSIILFRTAKITSVSYTHLDVYKRQYQECDHEEILEKCGIPRPKGLTVFTTQEALDAAHSLGYPVLVRP